MTLPLVGPLLDNTNSYSYSYSYSKWSSYFSLMFNDRLVRLHNSRIKPYYAVYEEL